MDLVFGGSYQGKTAFAMKTFGLGEEDIHTFEYGEIEWDFSSRACAHIERLIYSRLEKGMDVFDWFDSHLDDFREKTVICDDICCGVVPVEKLLRLYRDNVGKQMQIFSRESDSVWRVYAGIGEKLK